MDDLVTRLSKLQDTLPNQIGSLSRRIEFIKKEFSYSEIEKDNDLIIVNGRVPFLKKTNFK